MGEQNGFFKRIRMGAGYLPGYGDHPGTETVVFLVLLTGAAGLHAGWIGFVGGCGLGLVVYGPMWVAGCVGRANDYLRAKCALTTPIQEPS